MQVYKKWVRLLVIMQWWNWNICSSAAGLVVAFTVTLVSVKQIG